MRDLFEGVRMSNYYRSGYSVSRRRDRWLDLISLALIVIAMVAGIIVGIGIGHVGRAGLADQIEAQQATIDDLKQELETKAFFGHPRQLSKGV